MYGWSAGDGSGDVDHNGRVDVSDLQTVLARVKPEPEDPAHRGNAAADVRRQHDGRRRDATPGDRICATAAGICSLRAAIDEANRHAGPDTDHLQHPGRRAADDPAHARQAGHSTRPARTIDGYTEPGAHVEHRPDRLDNALPGIEIRGNGDAREGIDLHHERPTT